MTHVKEPLQWLPKKNTTIFFSLATHVIVLLLVSTIVPSSALSATLRSDIQVLESLSYVALTQHISEDPCEGSETFLGVMCSFTIENTTSRVTEINVDDDGFLSLNKNRFRGPIPETMFQLTKLSLSQNFFTEDISPGITRLKELKTINLIQEQYRLYIG
ncbi:hypothetical protein YC2023_111024 [Brassica napus]